MSTNRKIPTSIEKIPEEVWKIIGDYLPHKDIIRFSRASKQYYTLFQPSITVANLIHLVDEADYEVVNAIFLANQANSQLMFKHVNYTFPDGDTEWISPLKLAFKNLDTYMWVMFRSHCKDDIDREKFTEQAREQKEHIDLELLYDSYNKYLAILKDEDFTEQEKKDRWLAIGKMQRERKILPRHMLKEFCRIDYLWCTANFDCNQNPPPLAAPSCMNSIMDNSIKPSRFVTEPLFPSIIQSLGENSVLYRGGHYMSEACVDNGTLNLLSKQDCLTHDRIMFLHLYTQRLKDFKSLNNKDENKKILKF